MKAEVLARWHLDALEASEDGLVRTCRVLGEEYWTARGGKRRHWGRYVGELIALGFVRVTRRDEEGPASVRITDEGTRALRERHRGGA